MLKSYAELKCQFVKQNNLYHFTLLSGWGFFVRFFSFKSSVFSDLSPERELNTYYNKGEYL